MRSLIWIFMFGFGFSSCQSPAFHIEPQFDAVQAFAQGIAAVHQGGKWGFIDTSGAWVIEPRFIKAELGEEKVYQVTDESNQVFEIRKKTPNSNAWAALQPLEKSILVETSSGRRSVFEKDAYWGIKDEKGNILVAPQFDSIHYMGSNLFSAYTLPKGYCLLNADGLKRSAYFQEINPEIQFGRIRFRDDDRYGLMTPDGRISLPASWWRLEIVGQHIACSNGGQLQLYSDRIERLSDFLFDVVIPLDDQHWLAKIRDTGQATLFDAAGRVVKTLKLSDGIMMHGMLPVQNVRTQKWGCINSKGEEVIPFNFRCLESFWPNGKAVFLEEDQNGSVKRGLIDTKGQQVLPAIFNEIHWHQDGIYTVVQGNTIQLLDEKLNPLGEKTKKPMEYIGQGVYVMYKEKKSLKYQKSNWYTGDKAGFYWSRDLQISAVYSIDGQLLLDGKDAIENEPFPVVSEGLAAAKKNGLWGFVKCKTLD